MFAFPIPIVVRFGLNQRLRFELRQVKMDGSSNPIGRVNDIGLSTLISSSSEVLLPLDPVSKRSALWELDESPLVGVESRCSESSANGTLIQFQATNLHSDKVVQLFTYFTISLIPHSTNKFQVHIESLFWCLVQFQTLIYRSEIASNSSSPKWREFVVPTRYMATSSHSVIEFAW